MNSSCSRVGDAVIQGLSMLDQHVDSFNVLVSKWIPDIVKQIGRHEVKMDPKSTALFECQNVRDMAIPGMSPDECFRKNITYACQIQMDLKVTSQTISDDGRLKVVVTEYPNLILCHLPLMVYSARCVLSQCSTTEGNALLRAGTFITRGKTRYIPMVTSLVRNFPIRIKQRGVYIIHVRSQHIDKPHRSTSTIELQSRRAGSRATIFNSIVVKVPFLPTLLPLPVLIIALRGNILDFIMNLRTKTNHEPRYERYFQTMNIIGGEHDVNTAHEYIGALYPRPVDVEKILDNEILPHVGTKHQTKIKHLVCYVVDLLKFREGVLQESDRDHPKHMCIRTPGALLAGLFRVNFLKYIITAGKMARRYYQAGNGLNISSCFNHTRLTRRLYTALASGSFSKKRLGVSHSLNTTNLYSIYSQLRRVSSSALNAEGQCRSVREVHTSQYGFLCAAETPEGETCGLVQVLALTARVSPTIDGLGVMRLLLGEWGTNITDTYVHENYSIFHSSGILQGYTSVPDTLIRIFEYMVNIGAIHPMVTIARNESRKVLTVQTSAGRLVRPLCVVERLKQIDPAEVDGMLLEEIMEHGLIRYVTPCSPVGYTVAHTFDMYTQAKYCELSPISFVGMLAAFSPLFRHNQGPRLVYWIGMMKQMIVSSIRKEMGELNTHHLWYGQKPLVFTKTAASLNVDTAADGINACVMFYTNPFNQEDAIVVSRAAVEKGMFHSHAIRKHRHEIPNTGDINFTNPQVDGATDLRDVSYRHVGLDGLPKVGYALKTGDIIVGKTHSVKRRRLSVAERFGGDTKSRCELTDRSITVREQDCGTVLFNNMETMKEKKIASVHVSTHSIPQVGDKFSSRHSQKGTIGCLEDAENLPFSDTGMVPDIIMSPLCLTSRMTIGKLIEGIVGKNVAITGDYKLGMDKQDLTIPYTDGLRTMQDLLHKNGFKRDGTERFRDGKTGEIISADIFMGVIYTTKLNHMVSKKIHARTTGPINQLTRQPVEGRRHDGGIKFASMEAECIMAHGASAILKEKYVTSSDEYSLPICTECGYTGIYNGDIGFSYCPICRVADTVQCIQIGYTTKLMVQELLSTGVTVQLDIQRLKSHV